MGILNAFARKRELKKELADMDKDIDAVVDYFKEIPSEVNNVLKHFFEFKILRAKEILMVRNKAAESEIRKNVEEQLKKYDELLKDYEIFELDADINGQRVKNISKMLVQKAVKMNINPPLMEKFKKSERWNFNW